MIPVIPATNSTNRKPKSHAGATLKILNATKRATTKKML
jgi:hypothetical protein